MTYPSENSQADLERNPRGAPILMIMMVLRIYLNPPRTEHAPLFSNTFVPHGVLGDFRGPVLPKENYQRIILDRVTPQKLRPDATLRRIVGNFPNAHGDKAFSNLLPAGSSHAETS